ncbi:GGDEF domain-containing protein [Oleiagrimonas sp. C23AA]|uniref:GGDEF domain-containing protein n=1 Tax=Oleiagrimonas sp. C23AA TaxID=2719047 RepID=UPI001422EFDA|nr:GGDEF domain-containing protein [Oleiagrimonas sp. C23AA]NII09721.1 GGDEF domain-containing protein [Oleiagrimonas sp. C23AA]
MHLDAFTLAFVSFLISIGQALAFSLLLLILRRQPAMRWWTVGWWCSTLGLVLIALRGSIPDSLSILLGNGLFALDSVLLLKGLSVHLHCRFHWWPAIGLVTALLAGLGVYAFIVPDLRMRLRLFAVQEVIWDLWAMALLIRHGWRDLHLSARLASTVFAADALASLARMAMPLSTSGGSAFDQASGIAIFTYTLTLMLGLALMLSQIMLVTERITNDLRRTARTDGLTGLLNRGALQALARPLLAQCRNTQQPAALLLFDLDHFKHINDSFGHDAGDAVLQRFATLLLRAAEAHPGALACRHGGEEFVLMLPGMNLDAAHALAMTIRSELAAQPVHIAAQPITATTSVGVACAASEERLAALMARADTALYQAKRSGRDRVCVAGVAPPMDSPDSLTSPSPA